MKQLNLLSTTSIGISSIIGSGWLFACYYGVKLAGPLSLFAWIIGATLALSIALLLAEIATMYQETGLLSRLFSITHNKDAGFLVASANWCITVLLISSEALATIQYLVKAFPTAKNMYINGSLSPYGIICTCALILIYGLLNYWGAMLLASVNNIITLVKIIVPIGFSIIIFNTSFNPSNFVSLVADNSSNTPYTISSIFRAVIESGIFYAFYGFSMITVFAKELKNPQKNIPLALTNSILACLVIYILIQVAFIGAIPPKQVAFGWDKLEFSSPLVDLSILLGLNWLVLILFTTAAIAPSGSGIVYTGSGARMLYGMAQDHQVPKIFASLNMKFFVSRPSLIFTLLISMILVYFFDSWQKIVVVVSVFQIVSCTIIPISFNKLRKVEATKVRPFYLPYGSLISVITFVALNYLLIKSGVKALVFSINILLFFFLIYCISYYKSLTKSFKAFCSAWSLFAYLITALILAHIDSNNLIDPLPFSVLFLLLNVITYFSLLHQKAYNK